MKLIISTEGIKADVYELWDLSHMVLDSKDWFIDFWANGSEKGIVLETTPDWDEELKKWDFISTHDANRLIEFIQKYYRIDKEK